MSGSQYNVQLSEKANTYLKNLDKKDHTVAREKLKQLGTDPRGKGTEQLKNMDSLYRVHISRTHTAFYRIDDKNHTVSVEEICTIEKAHKVYNRYKSNKSGKKGGGNAGGSSKGGKKKKKSGKQKKK